jgi:hypothetical protein
MVRILISFIVACSLLASLDVAAQQAASPAPRPKTEVVSGNLYVKFNKNIPVTIEALRAHTTGVASVDALLDRYGVYQVEAFDESARNFDVCRRHGIDRMFVLYFQTENNTIQVAEAFRALDAIESVSPRYIFKPTFSTNDPQWSSQWALKSTRMNFETAWNGTKGNRNTIIAILDGGVNYMHEDLAANLFIDSGEIGLDNNGVDKRSNGKDDDGDGKKDNWRGWDLAGNAPVGSPKPDNDPMPDTSLRNHGTLVAGCAAAKPDNGKGIAGSGFNCSFMPVKTGNAEELYMGYEGIQYASTHDAKAIVCSWGGDIEEEYREILNDLIASATELGSLIVAAAGNASTDVDNTPFFPACFPLTLAVGATQENDKAASFSNFGKIVDVYAPGTNIFSTDLPAVNSYRSENGTSFSAPLVGGLVGLLATKFPEWSPQLIARQIILTCDNVVNTSNRTKYWGRVNAYRATTEPSFPGVVISGFSIDSVKNGFLDYINKPYTLDVQFKNVVSPGAVNIVLLNKENYNVSQSSASLGPVATGEVKNGRFVFTRDPAEYVGPGEEITLVFYATDGNKYKDTLYLHVVVSDDLTWEPSSVSFDENSSFRVENWPNPAHSTTTIRFTLERSDEIALRLIDMLGREVLSIPQSVYAAGMYDLELNLQDLPAGMYSYVLESRKGLRVTKQLVISR